MKKEEVLYIGLNGYAGSGKDTVAKALTLLLSREWKDINEFKTVWEHDAFTSDYATYMFNKTGSNCMCIAFADQLKSICSAMYGIPLEYFYYNKENSWIDVKHGFEFTQVMPKKSSIITADELYYEMNSNVKDPDKCYMSLREVLVYVGTYICQMYINKNVFVNGVENLVNNAIQKNSALKYIICTDVRFYHEFDYIKSHHGINVTIRRPSVEQLHNIAEHDLDDNDSYDYIIYNDSTYDELLSKLWDFVHDIVLQNITVSIGDITLRKISQDDTRTEYRTCIDIPCDNIVHNTTGNIQKVISGNDELYIGMVIDGKPVKKIEFDYDSNDFIVAT